MRYFPIRDVAAVAAVAGAALLVHAGARRRVASLDGRLSRVEAEDLPQVAELLDGLHEQLAGSDPRRLRRVV